MGCDGGTIPRRDELVKTKKKPEQKDKSSEMAFKWKHCAISQEELKKPIVACELGRLYNKESVLELLLDRSKFEMAAQFDHLRGLKDIKELNLTENPERRSKDAEKGDVYVDRSVSDYICPVVGLEMSGMYKFCFIWTCGCVVSERAIKQVKSDVCHKCGKPCKEEDVILLNGSEDDIELMKTKMESRRLAAKLAKKSKKADKHKLAPATSTVDDESAPKRPLKDSSTAGKPAAREKDRQSSSKLPASTKLVATASNKLVGASNGKTSDKTKVKKSIQDDPTASKTFKSLFTSCEKAKSQQQAHWVTFNPMYF